MICVSIGRGRHRHMIAEHRHVAEQGAKLVELRLDYINGPVNLKRLLPERPCPVVIACRRQRDGGKWTGTEEERQVLLRSAIVAGVEYVDLEDDIAGGIPRFGTTKRIVSHHDFRKTPEGLDELHGRLAAHDADIVKIAGLANNPLDNVRILELIRNSQVPTIGICMGDMGTPSRILAGKFGAPFTYATFHQERTLAPGQLSYQQMAELYHYDDIKEDTTVFGVIADPVGHSLSPLLHNAAFRAEGMNAIYAPFRVPRDQVANFLQAAPRLGIRGLSVTIPLKELVLPHLARMDNAVQGIGAANTILLTPDGWIGHNTDYRAAMDSLEAVVPGDDKRGWFREKRAVILGAGGAARAVAYGLKRRGCRVSIAGRTKERADELSRALGCESIGWESRHAIRADILVNCTPVGMHPSVDESPYNRAYLRPDMIVFDTVYNPERTLLVAQAREERCTVITGVEMFVRQAALQFKIFTGKEPSPELLRETLKRGTSAARM